MASNKKVCLLQSKTIPIYQCMIFASQQNSVWHSGDWGDSALCPLRPRILSISNAVSENIINNDYKEKLGGDMKFHTL